MFCSGAHGCHILTWSRKGQTTANIYFLQDNHTTLSNLYSANVIDIAATSYVWINCYNRTNLVETFHSFDNTIQQIALRGICLVKIQLLTKNALDIHFIQH